MARELVIGNRTLNDASPCYVIAELGHNHAGKVETAAKMIRQAAIAGASAVKLQKRNNATLYSKDLLNQPYENENSFGKTYGEHRAALEFNLQQYISCRAVAKSFCVDFFATAFDEASADFLMEVDVPAIKIASGSCLDERLLRHVARLGKPLLVSTGGVTFDELDRTVDLLHREDASFALLHCTAAYPVLNYEELNLLAIVEMRVRYPDVVIGWSGHDSGIAMSLVAYAYGARIIEKHFTLNRAMKGTDHAFSLEPAGLRKLCRDLGRAHVATGDGTKRQYDSERKPLSKMRRVWTDAGFRVTGEVHAHR